MQTIPITIQNKIASVPCGTFIVADNPTEYQLLFTFDSEWSGYAVKTARFLIGGYYTDVDFTGNAVTIPSMPSNVSKISVGVYADLLATTTPANISVMPSVLATAENATQYDPAEPTILPDVDELALNDTFVVNDVSEGEKARATIGQVVDYVQSVSQIEPADTNPLMDGEANVGSSDKYAREDHQHPTDTSRASQTDLDSLEYAVQNIGMIVAPMSDVVSELMNTVGELDRDTIKMTPQTLTTAQQAQARSNINAASIDDIGTVFTIKGEVTNVSDLPATGNTVGDVYYVSSVHAGYIWLETTDHPNGYWEELGEPIDLSAYRTAAAQDVIDGAQDTAIAAKYTKPSSGIPASDLASGVIPEKLVVTYTVTGNNTLSCDHTYNEIVAAMQAKTPLQGNMVYNNAVMGELTTVFLSPSGYIFWTYASGSDEVVYVQHTGSNQPTFGAWTSASDALPTHLGVASAGISGEVSRSDHVHPMPSASDVGAIPAITEVTVSTAGAVTQALDAGKMYHFTGALTSLTLTLNAAASGQLAQYHFDFVEGSTAFDPVLPASVVLPDGWTWAADMRYEVDILNNYAVVVGWAVSA